MRARLLAAAAGAVTAGSLVLWPSAAGAGAEPDEVEQSTRTVMVGGVACQVRGYAQRYTVDVYATTDVITTADQCRTSQVVVHVTWRTEHGDTVTALSGDDGPSANAGGTPAVDLIRSRHIVQFSNGQSIDFTLTSK